jgi:hypothetical protein
VSPTVALILGSAAVGALLSSLVNGVFTYLVQRGDLARRDLEMALKLAELKHQQLTATQEWHHRQGRDASVNLFDPLVSVIDYDRGIKEYRRTGRWLRGGDAHEAQRMEERNGPTR